MSTTDLDSTAVVTDDEPLGRHLPPLRQHGAVPLPLILVNALSTLRELSSIPFDNGKGQLLDNRVEATEHVLAIAKSYANSKKQQESASSILGQVTS